MYFFVPTYFALPRLYTMYIFGPRTSVSNCWMSPQRSGCPTVPVHWVSLCQRSMHNAFTKQTRYLALLATQTSFACWFSNNLQQEFSEEGGKRKKGLARWGQEFHERFEVFFRIKYRVYRDFIRSRFAFAFGSNCIIGGLEQRRLGSLTWIVC